MDVLVNKAGYGAMVQDLGRPGSRQFGIPVGGALDSVALRVANSLVGNEEAAAGLEVIFGGLELTFRDRRFVAWCGGEFDARIGPVDVPSGHRVRVEPNEVLNIGRPRNGCRCWIAISGGIDVPVALGSRGTDGRGGFGGVQGRALRDGDKVPLGSPEPEPSGDVVSSWSAPAAWASTSGAGSVVRILRGRDVDRFAAGEFERLTSEPFDVSADSDRMGVRLEGAALELDSTDQLVSEAVAPGTIQVPPSGQPIVLLGDCQTIGGYPKIAHVITVDLPIVAQLRAGDRVRFRETSLFEAHRLLRARERDLRFFKAGVALRRP